METYLLFLFTKKVQNYEPSIIEIVQQICFLQTEDITKQDYLWLRSNLGISYIHLNNYFIDINNFLHYNTIFNGIVYSNLDIYNYYGIDENPRIDPRIGYTDLNDCFSIFESDFEEESKLLLEYFFDVNL